MHADCTEVIKCDQNVGVYAENYIVSQLKQFSSNVFNIQPRR